MNGTQTKEHISRSSIEQELWRIHASDIRACALSTVYTLFFGGLISVLLCAVCRSAYLPPVLYLPLALLPLIPAAAVIRIGITVFRERTLLQNGAFDIVSATLSSKDETYSPLHRRLKRTFTFSGYPPCEVSNTAYQLASVGDSYYIILYRTPKPYVKCFYAEKQYIFSN